MVVAVGLFFAAQRDGAPEQAESLPAATPSPVVRPERPVRPARRRPEVARWITVTVVGLPPESEVLLDGLPASSPLRLRRDSEHVLEVRAPGYDPATLELETAHDHTVNPELRPSSDPG